MSVHALNTALVGFEVFATNTPPMPWLYALPTFLCLAAYLGVAYITHATQGFYSAPPPLLARKGEADKGQAYAFLDPKREHARLAAYIVGVGAAGLIIFALVRTVMWARARAVRALMARGTLRERLAPVHAEETAAREKGSGESAV
jgi:hypothetical protein